MRAEGLSDAAVAAFRHNYEALASGETGLLAESDLKPVDSLPSLEDLKGVYHCRADSRSCAGSSPASTRDRWQARLGGVAGQDVCAQAQRRAGHQHGAGEGEEPAQREGWAHIPGSHRAAGCASERSPGCARPGLRADEQLQHQRRHVRIPGPSTPGDGGAAAVGAAPEQVAQGGQGHACTRSLAQQPLS